MLWFGSDLVGDKVPRTDDWRQEIADGLDLQADQIIWSTSQSHSSGAIPRSAISGSPNTPLITTDDGFIEAQRHLCTA